MAIKASMSPRSRTPTPIECDWGNKDDRRGAIHRMVIQILEENMLEAGEQRPYSTSIQAETHVPRHKGGEVAS